MGGKECIDAGELERRRRVLDDRVQSYKNVDVMFLIDGTESMEPYLRATAAAVAELARNPPQKTRELELSLARSPTAITVRTKHKSTMLHLRRSLRRLIPQNSRVAGGGAERCPAIRKQIGSDSQSDALEAPFAALIRMAKFPRLWRPEAATRIIVHVADHLMQT
jgi:hypothetical protein